MFWYILPVNFHSYLALPSNGYIQDVPTPISRIWTSSLDVLSVLESIRVFNQSIYTSLPGTGGQSRSVGNSIDISIMILMIMMIMMW